MIEQIISGFSVALQFKNIIYGFIGVVIGNVVGVLPGLGPVAAISLLMPSTYYLEPATAIIMLAGIYYGAMYGGTITSVLVNIPGEAASIVTCLDGYQMAKKGQAGPALSLSTVGSFIGATISIIGMIFISIPATRFGLLFGPTEYSALMMLSLSLVCYLAQGSIIRSLLMCFVGLFLANIGMDAVSGVSRFTFGSLYLENGIDLIPIIMGLFGLGEVISNLEDDESEKTTIINTGFREVIPRWGDFRRSILPILRGSIVGFVIGLLPGGGALIASFASYAIEKKVSKEPEKFGTGMLEGVVGPETANNAASTSSFIPMFTLGIPTNAATAVLLGALTIYGLEPGPLLIIKSPDVFWGVVCSMFIGNVMLVVLNIPLISIWIHALKIPRHTLFPLIIIFCLIGAYTVSNNIQDMFYVIFFGIIGYGLKKYGYEPAPLVLAFVLGPLFEDNFRRALILSHGSFMIFIEKPISFFMIGITILLLILPLVRRRKR